jgi:replicative superfamily II helicase
VFQILGRAGRPGLDSVGYGIILTKDVEEKHWVEDHYFQKDTLANAFIPKYNDLGSGLNKLNTLKEQVLLRIYEEKRISLDQLKQFFEKTYFWFCIKQKMKENKIPIEQLLLIKEITPVNILKLHSDPKRVEELKAQIYPTKITRLTNSTISGYLKTDFGVYACQFDIDSGIQCSCGFKNGISDNFTSDEFSFEFCDHITSFLMYLIELPESNFEKYVNDIIPKSIRNQYILNYLFEKGLVIKEPDDTIKCSQFGKLIIRLYLYPASGVLIRYKLENKEIKSYKDLIKEAFDILKLENRIRDYNILNPILEWADEEPLDLILDKYNIMAGDLYSVRDNLERVITFIGIIASNLSMSGSDLAYKLPYVAEMCETLRIRIHYGIREELFDLVLRLNDVARVRARILYNAGYHTASQVKKENPYTLNQKTGLGINLCKKIIKGIKD